MDLLINNVSKQYSGIVWGLKEFSLKLGPGILGLLGPNGAGKSTLMNILATITRPTEGAVLWNGVDIVRKPNELRKVLGYLPQSFGVYPNLTGQEFLEYMVNTALTESNAQAITAAEMTGQYSLSKILGIWTLAAVPMGILSWVIFPALSPEYISDPLGAGVTRFVLLTLGLIWLFVLSMVIVRQDEGDLRWATIKRRLRLNTPRDVRSGEPRRRLWLWIIPFMIASIVWEMGFVPYIDKLWVSIFPFLAEPPGYGFGAVLQSQEILDQLVAA